MIPMVEAMKFTLPLPPNKANTRYAHWAMEHKAAKAYKKKARPAVLVQKQNQICGRGLCRDGAPLFTRCQVTAELWVPGAYDDDNITAILKWPLDLLKTEGVIKDDKRPWCRLTGIPEQHVIVVKKRKGDAPGDKLRRQQQANYRLELTVEARSEAG